MQQFTARIARRADLFSGAYDPVPDGLMLTPKRWSAKAIGGFRAAEIDVAGPVESLRHLLNWAGDRVEIIGPTGSILWVGYIRQVDANLGGPSVSMTADGVVNRCAVRYVRVLPNGAPESRLTAWAQDDASVNRYGKRELIYALDEATEADAVRVRDRLLERLAHPTPIVESGNDSQAGASLSCAGYWDALDSVYHLEPRGLVEHVGGGGGEQPLSAAYVATTIGFGALSASPGSDDVTDTANGFGVFEVGDVIKLAGSSNPDLNGVFTIKAVNSASHIELTDFNSSDPIPSQAAGPTITVTRGEGVMAYQVAQSFTIPSTSAWNAAGVAIRVRRVGVPSGPLYVDLMSDSGGSPGSVLEASSIAAIDVPEEADWVEIDWSNNDTLNPGTTYWLRIQSGVNSLSAYYQVGLDEDVGYSAGVMKIHNGSSWVTRDPNADMSFRIWGEAFSTTKLRDAASTLAEFSSTGTVVIREASGIGVRIYRDDDRTALEEVQDMLDLGMNDGRRLIAQVGTDRALVVGPVEASTANDLVLGEDGVLRYGGKTAVEPGKLIVGRYVTVPFLPRLGGSVGAGSEGIALLVEEAEYDATSGRLNLRTEGAPDPWAVLTRRKG
jgi:hypothetical protein